MSLDSSLVSQYGAGFRLLDSGPVSRYGVTFFRRNDRCDRPCGRLRADGKGGFGDSSPALGMTGDGARNDMKRIGIVNVN